MRVVCLFVCLFEEVAFLVSTGCRYIDLLTLIHNVSLSTGLNNERIC